MIHRSSDDSSTAITTLLDEWRGGNAGAAEEIIARTYGELRRVAQRHLRRERRDHTLQPTALLHEAYLRLLRQGPGPVATREDFYRLMAAEMRRRLIDHARRRLATKRGGGGLHEPLESYAIMAPPASGDDAEAMLERLDRAMRDLARDFPRAARVVELRFLAHLTTEETASHLGLSTGTVKREWTFARAWLAAALTSDSAAR